MAENIARALLEEKLYSTVIHNDHEMRIIAGKQEDAPAEYLILLMALWYIGGSISSGIDSYSAWNDITVLSTTGNYLSVILSATTKAYCHMKAIIVYDNYTAEQASTARKMGINLVTLNALIERGKSSTIALPKCKPHDPFIMMDTSGSLGIEKLVVATHELIVFSSVYACGDTFREYAETVQHAEQDIGIFTCLVVTQAWGAGGKIAWRSYKESIFDDMIRSNPTTLGIYPHVTNLAYHMMSVLWIMGSR